MPAKKKGSQKTKKTSSTLHCAQKNEPKNSNKKNRSQKKVIQKSAQSTFTEINRGSKRQILTTTPITLNTCKEENGYKYSLILFSVLICLSLIFFMTTATDFYSNYESDMLNFDEQASTLSAKYENERPSEWGEFLPGIITHFYTNKKELALTLDACGGKNGSLADRKLIDFLIDNKIKATLFVNARWIAVNKDLLLSMASTGLFDIENHGFSHRPLSVTPQAVYGIKGAGSSAAVIYEVGLGEMVIKNITDKKPQYFRSGTAYYDDISLKILKDLGYTAVAFSLNADEGATLSADTVYAKMMAAKGGDIIIAHMNRPESGTANGLMKALLVLVSSGYSFVKLTEVN